MANKIEKMQELVNAYADEREKFSAGNKSAGTRARKHLQDIKALAHEERLAIQSEKNNA